MCYMRYEVLSTTSAIADIDVTIADTFISRSTHLPLILAATK